VVMLSFSLISVVSNGLTLTYILKTFDIKAHVFTLIFVDAFIATLFSVISAFLYLALLIGQLHINFQSCGAILLAAYLPNSLGTMLVFLISSVRYILTRKSAKNIIVPNRSVQISTLTIFALACSVHFGILWILCPPQNTIFILYAILSGYPGCHTNPCQAGDSEPQFHQCGFFYNRCQAAVLA